MKKVNIHTYTDIQEKQISLPGIEDAFVGYEVSIKTVYDLVMFGINMKHVEEVETIPFLFNSFESAKDFLEVRPIYKKCTVSGLVNCIGMAKYPTYQLYTRDTKEFIGKIYWDPEFIKFGNEHLTVSFLIKTPLVEKFVADIWVPDKIDYNRYLNKNFFGWYGNPGRTVSELIRLRLPIVGNTDKKWNFELVNVCA